MNISRLIVWFAESVKYRVSRYQLMSLFISILIVCDIGHVNNVTYLRYAETARVNLMRNYAMHVDPAHKTEWLNTVGNKGTGLILQSIKLDYKFVRSMTTFHLTCFTRV